MWPGSQDKKLAGEKSWHCTIRPGIALVFNPGQTSIAFSRTFTVSHKTILGTYARSGATGGWLRAGTWWPDLPSEAATQVELPFQPRVEQRLGFSIEPDVPGHQRLVFIRKHLVLRLDCAFQILHSATQRLHSSQDALKIVLVIILFTRSLLVDLRREAFLPSTSKPRKTVG
mmetsp:Transcript_124333/g.284908  ORF Transcript_124333/g.284908 Transcript_124333/m.284908 type:complete len:172 (-) Transcript_124333:690-1205(-)